MEMTVSLTDHEWMSLIDGERGSLQKCCANISELRDEIILIARHGGAVSMYDARELVALYEQCAESHEMKEVLALTKLINQIKNQLLKNHHV